jgi:galactoside 2-L-fucosyltransferase 1/2
MELSSKTEQYRHDFSVLFRRICLLMAWRKRTATCALVVIGACTVICLMLFTEPPRETAWTFINPNATYVTVQTMEYWGVGNQMFGIAAMQGVSEAVDSEWRLCLPCPLDSREIFSQLSTDILPCCQATDLHNTSFAREELFAVYNDAVKSKPVAGRHVILGGYRQSWKYLAKSSDEVRRLFQFSEKIDQFANARIAKLVDRHFKCSGCVQNVTLVGVHVRRGDYLSFSSGELGYKPAPLSYILNAMEYMVKYLNDRTHLFLVSSNDIEWCQGSLGRRSDVAFLVRNTRFFFRPVLNALEEVGADLATLAKCNHSIMTVGTFGWWAAYLAGGHTVYYKDPFTNLSTLWNHANYNDFFPPQWVGLS